MPESLLHRQVNPCFLQADGLSSQVFVPTSQVFKPTPKDDKKLSVADGTKIEAEAAFNRFVQNPVCKSAGVLSVSPDECQKWRLTVIDNPLEEQPDHVLIDFSCKNGNGEIKKAAAGLRDFAWKRGWTYKP